ncbi:hypothetical protein STEG23_037437, partial [Scotinomys teguina]
PSAFCGFTDLTRLYFFILPYIKKATLNNFLTLATKPRDNQKAPVSSIHRPLFLKLDVSVPVLTINSLDRYFSSTHNILERCNIGLKRQLRECDITCRSVENRKQKIVTHYSEGSNKTNVE